MELSLRKKAEKVVYALSLILQDLMGKKYNMDRVSLMALRAENTEKRPLMDTG